ncbi:MAG: carboxylating nicotinate-nucleotide diphosphorylase [Planctomycetes bacterium]|nr:carboxylating nicotinate-nucleotide diphosphorylase [Planctomycetota bacterium]
MSKNFHQFDWDEAVEDDCRQIVLLAVREDLERQHDWTTLALVPRDARGWAAVVVREAGVVAGLPAMRLALSIFDDGVEFIEHLKDGTRARAGQTIATLKGSARTLLTAERTALNLLGRLCGIATLTAQYCAEVAGTNARIYDTRKTTPGWRRLEKYAVRCGGGQNHRSGLFDAVLIKDNHLALGAAAGSDGAFSPAEAVSRAREFLAESAAASASEMPSQMIVEIEVDTLAQLDEVLLVGPDIVLLDNMSCEQLTEAVARRDAAAANVQLEASGGVNLRAVGKLARTGVDRISVGALTHSPRCLDVGLDWLD